MSCLSSLRVHFDFTCGFASSSLRLHFDFASVQLVDSLRAHFDFTWFCFGSLPICLWTHCSFLSFRFHLRRHLGFTSFSLRCHFECVAISLCFTFHVNVDCLFDFTSMPLRLHSRSHFDFSSASLSIWLRVHFDFACELSPKSVSNQFRLLTRYMNKSPRTRKPCQIYAMAWHAVLDQIVLRGTSYHNRKWRKTNEFAFRLEAAKPVHATRKRPGGTPPQDRLWDHPGRVQGWGSVCWGGTIMLLGDLKDSKI